MLYGWCYIVIIRSIGGLRASIYNAQSLENVERLVEFMRKFEKDVERRD